METLEDLYLAGRNPEYDANAKKLLASRKILAWILKYCVPEFEDSTIEDIRDIYIQGTPEVASVPVMPDKTNARPLPRILGENTEDKTLTEGTVTFDIRFRASTPDGSALGLIINVEAQHSASVSYPLVTRALYYVSRLISSQKERDFVNSNFDDMKRVYSIWVCMNMDENSMNHIHLADERVLGNCEWKGKLDLLNIVMIGLAKELPPHDENYELHRLLGALLSKELTIDEKLNIIGTEYDIPMEEDFRKDVSVMCNLSQGIKEDGIEIGKAIGEAGIIINMHNNGFTAQQISAATNKDLKEVEKIIEGKELVTV